MSQRAIDTERVDSTLKILRVDRQTFVSARSLFGLTSGVLTVDSLIGGLEPNTIALLTGSGNHFILHTAEGYCIRAQLPIIKGGLGGGAFFIDGGNSFDVYLFTELARKYHLDYERALDRQLLSRAFTIYELLSLMEDAAFVLQKKPSTLLVISEVFSLFTKDVDRIEGRRIIKDIARVISQVSETEHVPVLITSTTRPEPFTQVLEDECNISADVREDNGRLCQSLYKHPSNPPITLTRDTVPRSLNQDILRVEEGKKQQKEVLLCG